MSKKHGLAILLVLLITVPSNWRYFTQGENLKFTGIPHLHRNLFRRVRLKDPLKTKALLKGLTQLSEEGATQLFRPLNCKRFNFRCRRRITI